MIGLEVLGWLIILFGIGLSIGLHEIGHLVPAKAFGVRVTQYMVGFGPTLWSRTKGETEYGVKAIPLGGYIRMIGMFPPEKGSDGTVLRESSTGRWSQLISQAREQSLVEVRPEDADRVFYKLPVRKRLVIMFGGPFMNLVLAFIFFAIAISMIGVPTAHDPSTVVSAVTACTPTNDNLDGEAMAGCVPSPANAAGLKAGDRVLAFDGQPMQTWDQLSTAITQSGGQTVTIEVDRDGSIIDLRADLVVAPRPVRDDDGQQVGTTTKTFFGMAPTQSVDYVREPLGAVPGHVWSTTTRAVGTIVTLPARLWDLIQTLTDDRPRDPEGVVGVVGVGRITGDAVALDAPIQDKAWFVAGILGGLNLFLFLFNLIPLLPLDGGHIAGALWEAIKRSYARLRHRPDPGPVDVAKALPVAYAVSGLLIVMSVILVYADIVKPITLQ